MKRLPYIAFLVLGFTASVYAQTKPCTLKPLNAPVLRGFKMGMSVTEAQGLTKWEIKGLKNEKDVFKATIRPYELKSADEAKGIKEVELSFFDDRLITIGIIYDESVKWDSVDTFAAKISESFNLPNTWMSPPDKKMAAYGRWLDCDGLRILVVAGKATVMGLIEQPVVALFFSDQTTNPAIEKRFEDAEKSKRQTFKP